jgi:hypothetical protein
MFPDAMVGFMPDPARVLVVPVAIGVTGSALMDVWSAAFARRFGIRTSTISRAETPTRTWPLCSGGSGRTLTYAARSCRRRADFLQATVFVFLAMVLYVRRLLNARRILIATGDRDELPDIQGVREQWGRDLLHCPHCHGWEVGDQPIGVLGTNAGSVQHALLVR